MHGLQQVKRYTKQGNKRAVRSNKAHNNLATIMDIKAKEPVQVLETTCRMFPTKK